jgi:ferredoxin-NADP reductase
MNAHAGKILDLIVDEVRAVTAEIKTFRMHAPDGTPLPAFAAGAHIRVCVLPEDGRQWRHYSLVNFELGAHATLSPGTYLIAVRREEGGQGGSRWMHDNVRPGDTLQVSGPENAFALDACNGAVLIAGGIGITPIASMATTLVSAGHRFTLHYSGRSLPDMVFVDKLRVLAGERLHIYSDDHPSNRLNLAELFATLQVTQPLYICGPKGMIDAAVALATERGWPREHIHVERFAEAAPQAGDSEFEVELRRTGMVLPVRSDQTILDAMIEAGLDPIFDCKRGECGICQTSVIEGDIEHRDYCLTDAEKRAGRIMQICVSRGRGPKLVLDA